MDIKRALLNVELDEEIFMTQPEGLLDFAKEAFACRLTKALNRLKLALDSGLRKELLTLARLRGPKAVSMISVLRKGS